MSPLVLIFLSAALQAPADTVAQSADTLAVITEQQGQLTISEIINGSDNIKVSHPEALEQRLHPRENKADEADEETSTETDVKAAAPKRLGGYRVLVFSDNNARTAKTEAHAKAKAIAGKSHYPTYVVFESPYWKLKVGDFKTREEAEVAAAELKRLFPSYSREIIVVRDRINSPK